MMIQEIIDFLNKEKQLLNKLILNTSLPSKLNANKIILQKILKKYLWLQSTQEIIYLFKHKNDIKNLNIFCPICGKKNKFISKMRGYTIYCSKKCMYNSPLRTERFRNSAKNNIDNLGRNSFQRRAQKSKETCYNTIDENGNNIYQRAAIKAVQTKRLNIDENGLDTYKRTGQKIKNILLSNIDENGLNGYDRAVQTKRQNIDKDGLNCLQRAGRKSVITAKFNIDKNGDNSYQRASKKIVQKRKNDIDINGLNSYQRSALKAIQTMHNSIDENGNDGYQRSIKKGSQTLFKKRGIYNVSQKHLKHVEDINEKFFREHFIIDNKFDVLSCLKYFNAAGMCWISSHKRQFNIIEPNNSAGSIPQQKIFDFVKSNYNGKILFDTKRVLKNRQLDLYMPEIKLAIEFNGMYWHSINKVHNDIYYHQNKSLMCKEKNIRLIHIFEYELNDKKYKNFIESLIKKELFNNLKNEKNFIIKPISQNLFNDFCKRYNVCYNIKTNLRLGLFIDNKLIQVLAFINKNNIYKIVLNCQSFDLYRDYTCELLRYFKHNYKFDFIICNEDFNKFDGKRYIKNGFIIKKIIKPKKFYYDVKSKKVYTNFDIEKINLNFLLYDAGKIKLVYKYIDSEREVKKQAGLI